LGLAVRVAIVHDYLTQMGGAERVLDALHALFPDAPVFTSVVDEAVLPKSWKDWDIRPSLLSDLPRAERWHRSVPPVYPALFRGFRRVLRDYDLVLSDTSAWAHQAPAGIGKIHVSYCHSPARFLYKDDAYLGPARVHPLLRPVMRGMFSMLRQVDRQAAGRVDRYVANSNTVRERIKAAYGVDASVVYPPVDVSRIGAVAETLPAAPEDWYVVVSRLVPHKRVDLAVAAFNRLGMPLKIVGEGRAIERLRELARPNVEFLGRQSDEAVAELLGRSRGLILPAKEDFGITAVEAQAAGRPVIALDAGGAQESVLPGVTGVLFPNSTPESLRDAVTSAE
jgi:glycosyltransferase involved in cell wall biosynthesis